MHGKPNYYPEMYSPDRKSTVYLEAEFFWHFRIIRKAPRILIPALIYLILDWLGILFTLNSELPNVVSFPLILIIYPEAGAWIQQFPLFFAYLVVKSIYDFILFPIWVTILVKESLMEKQTPVSLIKSFTYTFRFIGLYLLQFIFIILGIVGYLIIYGLLSLGGLILATFGMVAIILLFYMILFDLLGVMTFIVAIFRNNTTFKTNFQDAWFIIKQKGSKLVGLSMSRNWILIPVFIIIALINWGILLLFNNSLTFPEAFGTFDLSFYIMVFIYVHFISLAPEIKNLVR